MGFTDTPALVQLIRFTSENEFQALIVLTAMKQTGLPYMPGGLLSTGVTRLSLHRHTNGSHPAIAIGFSNSPAIS